MRDSSAEDGGRLVGEEGDARIWGSSSHVLSMSWRVDNTIVGKSSRGSEPVTERPQWFSLHVRQCLENVGHTLCVCRVDRTHWRSDVFVRPSQNVLCTILGTRDPGHFTRVNPSPRHAFLAFGSDRRAWLCANSGNIRALTGWRGNLDVHRKGTLGIGGFLISVCLDTQRSQSSWSQIEFLQREAVSTQFAQLECARCLVLFWMWLVTLLLDRPRVTVFFGTNQSFSVWRMLDSQVLVRKHCAEIDVVHTPSPSTKALFGKPGLVVFGLLWRFWRLLNMNENRCRNRPFFRDGGGGFRTKSRFYPSWHRCLSLIHWISFPTLFASTVRVPFEENVLVALRSLLWG